MKCVFVVKILLFVAFSIEPYAGFTMSTDLSVTAYQGSDVRLGCNFTNNAEINLRKLHVRWIVNTTRVAEFNDDVKYYGRKATLTVDELRKGNASLYLPNIQKSDEGIYTCKVLYTPYIDSKDITLTVKEKGNTGHRTAPGNLIFWTALMLTVWRMLEHPHLS